MSELSDIFSRKLPSNSGSSFLIYGTAIGNSANGEVLVKFDDPSDEVESEGEDVILSDDADTADAIDEDYEEDVIGDTDDESDIDDDETYYDITDSDQTLDEDGEEF